MPRSSSRELSVFARHHVKSVTNHYNQHLRPRPRRRSYYALSKAHHPDHNPSDPAGAGRRFMRISEAYAVLGHVDKRARYDRDVMARAAARQPRSAPRGSYSSTGPAGGRPASGLSRRRGTFQGPPPSFFRSGGWGAHGAKRRAAHEESTGGAGGGEGAASAPRSASGRSNSASGTRGSVPEGGAAATWPGMGPGQNPYGRNGEVPHFDRDGHKRTWQRADERRARRRDDRDVSFVPDLSATAGFIAVFGALFFGLAAPALLVSGWAGLHNADGKERPSVDGGHR